MLIPSPHDENNQQGSRCDENEEQEQSFQIERKSINRSIGKKYIIDIDSTVFVHNVVLTILHANIGISEGKASAPVDCLVEEERIPDIQYAQIEFIFEFNLIIIWIPRSIEFAQQH